MWKYATRRVLTMIPILIGVSMVVFLLVASLPGDAVDAHAGGNITAEKIAQNKACLLYTSAANVTEDDLANDGADNAGVQKVREYAAEENCEVFVVCAQIEQEIAELDEDEKKLFLDDLGLEESGLEKLIKACLLYTSTKYIN